MSPDPAAEYLLRARSLLDAVLETQLEQIHRAGDLVADTIAADALVHVFGSGHSHMLAEELFYRAGGLASVNPVLLEEFMLHGSATTATALEREAGHGARIFAGMDVAPGDVLIVASASGGSVVTAELAEVARGAGVPVIAIFSVAHARGSARGGEVRLAEVADVVIDNCGAPGDAAVTVPGVPLPVGPTSTVAGAAIVNAIAVRAVTHALALGAQPPVFFSSNVAGGDAHNRVLLERFQPRVGSL